MNVVDVVPTLEEIVMNDLDSPVPCGERQVTDDPVVQVVLAHTSSSKAWVGVLLLGPKFMPENVTRIPPVVGEL